MIVSVITTHPSLQPFISEEVVVGVFAIILSLLFYSLSPLSSVGITRDFAPVDRTHGFVFIEMKRRSSQDDSPAPTTVVTEDSISIDNETPCTPLTSKIRRRGSKLLSVYRLLTGRAHGEFDKATGAHRKHHTATHDGLKSSPDFLAIAEVRLAPSPSPSYEKQRKNLQSFSQESSSSLSRPDILLRRMASVLLRTSTEPITVRRSVTKGRPSVQS